MDEKHDTTTVLLVEDEQRLLLGLGAIMERAGYRVLSASDGTEGLKIARSEHPDIVISDIMMPPPDGFELRKILLQDESTASIPFIFLSARTALRDRVRGIEDGADDYITKPFDSRELLARVASVLRRRRIGKEEGRAEVEEEIRKTRLSLLEQVSMELRWPIARLMEALKPALGARFTGNPEQLTEFLESAADSATRMEARVRDLSALVRLEEYHPLLNRKPVNLQRHFRAVVEACHEHWRRFEFKDLDLSISTEELPPPEVDEELFALSIHHLMDNACKFSPDGGKIDVRCSSSENGDCIFSFRDQGCGIRDEIREKVFDPFFRGQTNSDDGGLGLGLTIARLTARRYGGDTRILDSPADCLVEFRIPRSGSETG